MGKAIDRPEPCYLKIRAWQRSPYWVPARIYRPVPIDPDTGELLDRWPQLQAEAGDYHYTDFNHVCDLWNYGRAITEEEHEWLTAIWPLTKKLAPKGTQVRYSTETPS